MHPGRAVVVTLAGALAGLFLVLVLVLSDQDVRLAGTNNVLDRFPVATLERGDELCEQHEVVPADAAEVRFSVEPGSGGRAGRLRVRVLDDGRAVSRGTAESAGRAIPSTCPSRPCRARSPMRRSAWRTAALRRSLCAGTAFSPTGSASL